MDLTPVTCNNCGASLEVPNDARFVTCRYCNSQLEIKRSETSITTEVLQRLEQTTTAMADDLHAIRRDAEVERLDREWNLRRQGLMTQRKDGTTAAPAAAIGYVMLTWGFIGGAVGLVIFSLFGVLFAGMIRAAGAPAPCLLVPCALPLFVIGIIALNTFMAIKIINAAKAYQQEEAIYLQRRQQLLAAPAEQPAAQGQ